MILFIGDSLAVGTPLAQAITGERVVKRAVGGIQTKPGLDAFLHPVTGARVLVVSLGTNDARNIDTAIEQIPRVKRAARDAGACLAWITIRGWLPPEEKRFNQALRDHNVVTVPWAAAVDRGDVALLDGIHPGLTGYQFRARLIRSTIKEKCA